VPIDVTDLYEHGSKTCQQYSELVTRVRTLAQQTFLVSALGVGIALSKSAPSSEYIVGVLLLGGVCLFLFGGALWALNHHYSIAFNAIRDTCLVPIEKKGGFSPPITIPLSRDTDAVAGPWGAHQRVREVATTWRALAWNGPFIAILLLATIAITAGLSLALR